MAIADGMEINCSNLQAVGGTRFIAVRAQTSTQEVVFDNSAHTITEIDQSTGVGANWGVFESRIESSSLTVSGTNEGKEFTTYECTVSWFIPGMTKSQFNQIYKFDGDCLNVMVIDNNDETSGDTEPAATYGRNKVIGLSGTLPNQDTNATERSQQWARLSTVEGGTGAAFSDEMGVTVTIVGTQHEIPRTYVGTITIDADGLGLVTT